MKAEPPFDPTPGFVIDHGPVQKLLTGPELAAHTLPEGFKGLTAINARVFIVPLLWARQYKA